MADGHRFTVTFSDAAFGDLTALAESSGKTLAQVLRDAIALEAWFNRTRAEENKVLVESPDGRIREVIPR